MKIEAKDKSLMIYAIYVMKVCWNCVLTLNSYKLFNIVEYIIINIYVTMNFVNLIGISFQVDLKYLKKIYIADLSYFIP